MLHIKSPAQSMDFGISFLEFEILKYVTPPSPSERAGKRSHITKNTRDKTEILLRYSKALKH